MTNVPVRIKNAVIKEEEQSKKVAPTKNNKEEILLSPELNDLKRELTKNENKAEDRNKYNKVETKKVEKVEKKGKTFQSKKK
jgi:hypothetical protein